MRTPTTRQQHSRPVTRYQTDLTDAHGVVIAPHLPEPLCDFSRFSRMSRDDRGLVWPALIFVAAIVGSVGP